MTETSPRLGLPYLQPAQAQKHVTVNSAQARLDALVQLTVPRFGETDPPADPAEGALHAIAAAGATGAWAGQEGRLAQLSGGGWIFIAPQPGWRAWGQAEGELRVWTGSAWEAARGATQNLPGLGVNAAWDAGNRLSVAADGTLFSHAGAGHRVAVNKAAPGETASLLFQSDWTGHAEMGLAGDTAFALKTSADGSAWTEMLRVTDTEVEIAAPVTGSAVQADGDDATPGRLMLAQHGVLRSAILGTVSQSGGEPTGALAETGSTAAGRYLRLADGTQLCWASRAAGSAWSFPAAFAGGAADRVVTAVATGTLPRLCVVGDHLAGSCVPRLFDLSGTEQAGAVHLVAAGRWF